MKGSVNLLFLKGLIEWASEPDCIGALIVDKFDWFKLTKEFNNLEACKGMLIFY